MGCFSSRKAESGLTLIEIFVVLVLMAILAAAAIPAFSVWLPNYRLKNAARDLYSNLQLAKMGAVSKNRDWAVIFDNVSSPGRYFIAAEPGENGDWEGPDSDDSIEKTVDLA